MLDGEWEDRPRIRECIEEESTITLEDRLTSGRVHREDIPDEGSTAYESNRPSMPVQSDYFAGRHRRSQ